MGAPPPLDPPPVGFEIMGITLRAKHPDGRRAWFRVPLIDTRRRACGTWAGDRSLICAILALLCDPEEDPDDLHSVALAMRLAVGQDGDLSNVAELLSLLHPRITLAREAAERGWRGVQGWDNLGDGDGGLFV